ncbi:hypothetical protein PAMA_015836 [Pampus argenteus]
MSFKDLMKWNTRMSAVYAVGVWTMVSTYAYCYYTGRFEDKSAQNQNVEQEPENPNQVVHETAHSKTIITYKKDFVPYTTRISSFIKSFSSEK